MIRRTKLTALRVLKSAGIFRLVANSSWRRERLLILCYHGTSLEDEHRWRPALYLEADRFEQRLQMLKAGGYSVLPLGEGLQRMQSGTLPHRSVAITFDDGTYDFYRQAYPRLKQYGYPATVYLTSYYMDCQLPVFGLIASYMLWKRRGVVISDGREIGLSEPLDLRTEAGRHQVAQGLVRIAERDDMTGLQKDGLARRLAAFLKIDYDALVAKRLLQIMNRQEVREIANAGIDVQLHTHRHRTPEDEELFRREIRDNRERIREVTGRDPVHFCYPLGVYRKQFFEWLGREQVISATTCDAGLATRGSASMLVPRYIDNQNRDLIDLESWLCGVGDLLAYRRAAPQKYVPRETDG
ncbi:MAG TPA: polysaccharide deacetylase family protein [Terriglobales bacterium]|nr:polysaccharide deacetylase family protein [Terriglobales bacterium]